MSENEIQLMGTDLIGKALENNVTPEALQKVLDMQLQWQANEARKAFKMAMAAFQAEKPVIAKTEKAYSSKYAPLSKIQQSIDPVLSKHGLSYQWKQEQSEDGSITITCILSHEAGHEESMHLTANPDGSGSKNPIQQIGSTVSYLKRYTLEGIVGLSSDKDDDGGKPKLKEDLSPKHPKWAGAIDALKKGQTTIEAIKKSYNLNEANEAKLIKEGGAK